MTDVTHILSAIEQGDPHAAGQLLPLVYDQLRKLATEKMANERPGQTLQATALVHEAYLRLVDVNRAQHWNSRGHFFAAAAEAMRRILIENARSKAREKRGGDWQRVDFEELDVTSSVSPDQLVALDDALVRLAALDHLAGELVKLRYFAGLALDQAAVALGVSTATAYRHWAYARAWLRDGLVTPLELDRPPHQRLALVVDLAGHIPPPRAAGDGAAGQGGRPPAISGRCCTYFCLS
jgi:RNA polymerase sigma factor (TIGR02999 family)